MKASERVLLPNGQFADFPSRLEERAIATGAKEAKAQGNEADPNLPRNDKAKKELEAKAKKEEAEAKKKAKEEAAAKKAQKEAEAKAAAETKKEENVENQLAEESDSMPSEVHGESQE